MAQSSGNVGRGGQSVRSKSGRHFGVTCNPVPDTSVFEDLQGRDIQGRNQDNRLPSPGLPSSRLRRGLALSVGVEADIFLRRERQRGAVNSQPARGTLECTREEVSPYYPEPQEKEREDAHFLLCLVSSCFQRWTSGVVTGTWRWRSRIRRRQLDNFELTPMGLTNAHATLQRMRELKSPEPHTKEAEILALPITSPDNKYVRVVRDNFFKYVNLYTILSQSWPSVSVNFIREQDSADRTKNQFAADFV
ncbi:hypothetical protein DPEC_G00004900 [Dallia pectoralis]|uniref:Uncharacterized protein n=1 Tax=Dallia pectoralis TaxID=75939 RepID=A0ACC2HJS9_DALPE|nr:hypothetical protein DPEC_G00004900 [Dallia pectoralis]